MKTWFHPKQGTYLKATDSRARSRSAAFMKANGFILLENKYGKGDRALRADKYYLLRKYNPKTQLWEHEEVTYDGWKKAENLIAEGWEVAQGKGIPMDEKFIFKGELSNLLTALIKNKK